MLLFLSLSGIFLSLVLLHNNAGEFRSSIYLGIFFFVVSLYGINQYVLLYSKSVFWISLIITNISFTSYLIGPSLYWYIRSILTDNSKLRKKDLFHLLPMLVYLTAAMPYILTPYSYKVEIANAIVKDVSFVGTFNFTILSEIFSNAVVYLSRPVLALIYTLWSVMLLIRYLRRNPKLFILSKQFFMIKWLSVLLGFQLLLTLSHLFSLFVTFMNSSDVFFTLNIMQLLSGVGMIGLLSSPFFFPGILYGLPRIPDSIIRK